MTTAPVERPGRWALPPQPPETWVGSTATLVLLGALTTGVAVPTLVLLPDTRPSTIALATVFAVATVLSSVSSYLLVVQASVTQDRRLAWAAGGFAALAVVYLARSVHPVVPGHVDSPTEVRRAVALSACWLLALPVTTLLGQLRRFGSALLVVPAGLLVAAGLGISELDLLDGDLSLTGTGQGVLLAAALLSLAGGLRWRQRVPRGNVGAWGWVGAALLLAPAVGVVQVVTGGPTEERAWAALAVEVVVLLVPAVGLYVVSARGYLKQAGRWRQLESEVRALRASSALLPGLSITPEDEAGLPERVEVLALIAAADMQVALQPVLDLRTLLPVGQEALARFGGRVPTDRWFRAAGLHDLTAELERMTLARALATLCLLPEGEFLAVNTSPGSLHDDEVLRMLHGSDLSRVVIEITEHDAVNDYAVTREELGRLRRAGARIAVDDVGAGFASLRHVLLLQPDVVKLDTSLTRDVHESVRQQAIVRALVTFADEVGAVVLAEGIEIAEQVPALVDAGVTLGQGWHLGIPAIR